MRDGRKLFNRQEGSQNARLGSGRFQRQTQRFRVPADNRAGVGILRFGNEFFFFGNAGEPNVAYSFFCQRQGVTVRDLGWQAQRLRGYSVGSLGHDGSRCRIR